MIPRRSIVWIVVAASAVLGAAILFWRSSPVETNLLALLPTVERHPISAAASAKLAEAGARRSVFLIGAASTTSAEALAHRFAAVLAKASVFREVRADFPPPDPSAVRELYRSHRFHVMSDDDRRALAAGDARAFLQERLRRRFYDPFRASFGVPLDVDPFGLLDRFLTGLPYARLSEPLEFADGMLLARDGARVYAVALAELDGSPHDPSVQKRVEASVADALAAVRSVDAGVATLHTGVVHYAQAARASAEREIDRIAVGSLIGIVALLLGVFRSLSPLLLGLLSVAVGISAAALATVAVFGGVHVITLVFGASLIGEAIDYSIQYFAARLDAGEAWEPWRGLGAVFPGITIALATSVLGYSALAAASFPALRQIALFAIVGLLAAYLTVVLLVPALARSPARYRPRALLQAAAKLWAWCAPLRRGRARAAILIVLAAASVPGWLKLATADDIRLLVNPPADLLAEEAAVRRLTGFAASAQFFVVDGKDPQELLEREEALTARLREQMRIGGLEYYQATSDFVPSLRRQREIYSLWRERLFAPADAVSPVLAENGVRRDVAARYADDFRRSAERTLAPADWFASPASAPFKHLWLGEVAGRHVSVVMPVGFKSVAMLEDLTDGLAGVNLADKAGEVSRLFREFRRSGSLLLAVAALLVYAVLAWRYGPRQGFWAMLPTLAAIGITLAYGGYAATTMTLFTIMALLLVLGVGINYVIFLHEGIERRAAALVGVLLSATTTLLSFGLLAWSATPALSQFGATLFVGIIVTVLLAPVLGPSSTRVRL